MEQVYFLDLESGRLQKLEELPRPKDPYLDQLIGDLIPGNLERVWLQPPSTGSLGDQNFGKNATDKTALQFEEVVGLWQGLHRNPERGFAWIVPSSKQKWLYVIDLILLFLIALWGNYRYGNKTDLRVKELRRPIHVLEERLDEKRKLRKESPRILEKTLLFENLERSVAKLRHHREGILELLHQVMAGIHDACLESIRFQKDEFILTLYTLKAEEIHSLLNEIQSLQWIDWIELESRKQEQMKGRQVTRFVFRARSASFSENGR